MRILVIEDDPSQRELIVRVLETLAFEIAEAGSIAEAQAAIQRFDVAIVDFQLTDGTARDLQGYGVPLVVLSGYEAPPDGKPWTGQWIRKPFSLTELRDHVTHAIANVGLNRPDPI